MILSRKRMPEKKKIRSMFDSIAGEYDSLNHILSLNIDKIWRSRAVKEVLKDKFGGVEYDKTGRDRDSGNK